jgi:hypothetical protein
LLVEMVPNADQGTPGIPGDSWANAWMTPEQWVAEEKLMPGALVGYKYVEDCSP